MKNLIALILLSLSAPAFAGLPIKNLLVPDLPVYPKEALVRQLSGEVIVKFDISRMGIPDNIRVIESPNSMFEKASIESLMKLWFRPALKDGEIIPVKGMIVSYDYEFDLSALAYSVHLISHGNPPGEKEAER